MFTPKRYDVLGVGNAIVDAIAPCEENFLIKQGLHKGGMALVDEEKADALYAAMSATELTSGGSAANTIAGVASLGGKGAFIGKVRNDESGDAFRNDITAMGVEFSTPAATNGPSTARCLVSVTPDGERTMSTYLGACVDLGPDDIDDKIVSNASIVYLEGYLWDPEKAKLAFRKASRLAHNAGAKVALSLSDAFCVDRYRDEFLELMRTGVVDIIFCNASELHALYQTADFDTASAALAKEKILGFVTQSEQGCLIVHNGETIRVPAAPIERVVDTTGAGDLFAAGVLFGLSRNLTHEKSARIGALAAAEVIQHFGARPKTSLADLLAQSNIL